MLSQENTVQLGFLDELFYFAGLYPCFEPKQICKQVACIQFLRAAALGRGSVIRRLGAVKAAHK